MNPSWLCVSWLSVPKSRVNTYGVGTWNSKLWLEYILKEAYPFFKNHDYAWILELEVYFCSTANVFAWLNQLVGLPLRASRCNVTRNISGEVTLSWNWGLGLSCVFLRQPLSFWILSLLLLMFAEVSNVMISKMRLLEHLTICCRWPSVQALLLFSRFLFTSTNW